MTLLYATGFEMGSKDLLGDTISSMSVVTTHVRGYWSSYSMGGNHGRFDQTVGARSEVYAGFGMYMTSTGFPDDSDEGLMSFRDAGGASTDQCGLTVRSSKLTARRGRDIFGGFGPILQDGSLTISSDRWYYIEIYVKIANSGGRFIVYVDENYASPDIDYTGDTQITANASLDRISMGNSASFWYDDLYVDSAKNWGDIAIAPLLVDGDGDHTGLSIGGSSPPANNYQAVDEVPPNDATDYVYGTGIGPYDLYTLSSTPSELTDVKAAIAWGRAQKIDAGIAKIALGVKSGGTEDFGADQTLSTSWAYYHRIMEVDPTDSAAWTTTKLNALQAGVKLR